MQGAAGGPPRRSMQMNHTLSEINSLARSDRRASERVSEGASEWASELPVRARSSVRLSARMRAHTRAPESACVRGDSANVRQQMAQLINKGNRRLLRRPIMMHRHPRRKARGPASQASGEFCVAPVIRFTAPGLVRGSAC